MEYRPLGSTGLRVSAISFGAGPVPGLLTRPELGADGGGVIRAALDAGINWFDTAPTYGGGLSETNLGMALKENHVSGDVHVATKVRIPDDYPADVSAFVAASVEGSLQRLELSRVTMLQLHNSITARRGDEPTSVTPEDVLGPNGILKAFQSIRQSGLALHLGLTGLGTPACVCQVLASGQFAAVQVPFNLLNPTAGYSMPGWDDEFNYENLIETCIRERVAVFAIRVLAGGALALKEPSEHTLKTRFFPAALYERDRERAHRLLSNLPPGTSLTEAAIRFAVQKPGVTSAIVGFSDAAQVGEAMHSLAPGLSADELKRTVMAAP